MDITISELFKNVKVMKEPCDANGLWKVSRLIVTTPHQFGACLGLPHEDTVCVDRNHADYRDKIYNLLISWSRTRLYHGGTWLDLVGRLGQLSERVLLEAAGPDWRRRDMKPQSLDSGIGHEGTMNETEIARNGVGVCYSAPPTSYSSYTTCSSFSSVEADSPHTFFGAQTTDPSDPYPSLYLGAQTTDPYPSLHLGAQTTASSDPYPSLHLGAQTTAPSDLYPSLQLGAQSQSHEDSVGVMVTGHAHDDTSGVFHTPFSTMDEDHSSISGAHLTMNNGQYHRQFSAVSGSCDHPLGSGDPPYGPQLSKPAHRTFNNSSASIRHDSRSDGQLHMLHADVKTNDLMAKLKNCTIQVACCLKRVKCRNEELQLKKGALLVKKGKLKKENRTLEQEIQTLEEINSRHRHYPASPGKHIHRLMDELSWLQREYREASERGASLALDCADLKVQCDEEIGRNVLCQLERNELRRRVQLERSNQGQRPPPIYQRQRSRSDSDYDFSHSDSSPFSSFGPSSFECHI